MLTLKYIYFLLLFIRISSETITENDLVISNLNYEDFVDKIDELVKQNSNISTECRTQFDQYKIDLKKMQTWALKMFDSGAKIPSGIFEGNFVDLGSFDQCLNINETTNGLSISGKYCLARLPIKINSNPEFLKTLAKFPVSVNGDEQEKSKVSINLQLATCTPNACSAKEVEQLFQKIFPSMVFNENECQTKDTSPELSGGCIAFLSFLGIILLIMIASSVYDGVLLYMKKKNTAHPMLTSFSVITNGRKLFTVSNDSQQISCLHGIRVISTVWVIIGHRYQTQFFFPVKNMLYLQEWIDSKWSMFIKGGTLSVDTFFLISGLTISYIYMHAAVKNVKFNIILFYLHRYLRLTPLLAIVALWYMTIFQHLGSGPLWSNSVIGMKTDCEENWWKALLYIQNYGNLKMCVSQSWYLSVDTQLYVLSPLLLIPLSKWPGLVLSLTGVLGICSIISCFLTTWVFEFNISMAGGNIDPEVIANYNKYYYFATYTRAAPWFVGIVLGYILFQVKYKGGRIVMNKIMVLILWMTSLAILVTCVYAGYNLSKKEYNKIAVASHLAFERPIWGVAVAWVIFACVTGYGGPVNWFLSLPIFQVVSRFTYSLYLSHLAIIYLTTAQMRTAPVVNDSREMYVFWGDFALTFAVSVIMTLAFESPIITIEKWLFGRKPNKTPSIEAEQRASEA